MAVAFSLTLAGCDASPPRAYQGYVEGDFVYVAGKIAGRLDKLAVAKGDTVTAGQTLYVLEHAYEEQGVVRAAADLRQAQDTLRDKEKGLRPEEIDQILAELGQARAAKKLSGLEYDRRVLLFSDATIAKEELDQSKATKDRDRDLVQQAKAKLATGYLPSRIDQIKAAADVVEATRAVLEQAKWDLGQKTQAAGVAGLVYDTLHFEGDWVAAGSPVLALLPPQNVKARFYLPEAVAGGLRLGQKIRVAFDGGREPVEATVAYVSPKVEYTPPVIYSQTFREKLVIMAEAVFAPEVAVRMHPGQPVDVYLDDGPVGGGK